MCAASVRWPSRSSRVPPRRAGSFLVPTRKEPKKRPRFNAARFAHGALRCSRRRGPAELALAALGAQTVLGPAVLCTSEPGDAALLGVSEGEEEASTFPRCRISVAWMQAEGRNPGCAVEHLDTPAPDFAALHPGYETHAIVAQPMVLTFGSRRERRTEVSAGGAVRTRCLRRAAPSSRGRPTGDAVVRAARRAANAGSSFLGYFF